MFPFNFEWIWDMSHLVFMGGLWYAMGIIGAGLTWCIGKTIYDTMMESEGNGDGHH